MASEWKPTILNLGLNTVIFQHWRKNWPFPFSWSSPGCISNTAPSWVDWIWTIFLPEGLTLLWPWVEDKTPLYPSLKWGNDQRLGSPVASTLSKEVAQDPHLLKAGALRRNSLDRSSLESHLPYLTPCTVQPWLSGGRVHTGLWIPGEAVVWEARWMLPTTSSPWESPGKGL